MQETWARFLGREDPLEGTATYSSILAWRIPMDRGVWQASYSPWGRKELDTTKHIYWRRQWQLTPVLLPGKSHGWRSLVGCSPWGPKESDMTERLHFHFSLSCIGEGNGNPLQCSWLENPRDGGAWLAAIFGVAQSWTRLKRLSSSSSKHIHFTSTVKFSA